ncbi:MAG: hypothetical protein ACKOAS_03320 [Verrucomicrobiota bacterium]
MRRALRAAPVLLLIALASAKADPPIVSTRPTDATAAAPKKLPTLDETAIGLADAARNLPAAARLQTTRAALSILLLSRFNRLLPASTSPEQLDELAAAFLTEKPEPLRQAALAKRLPPADSLIFDGSRLAGGNFRNIDAIMGLDGRPIALDRELPAWIVPLEPAAVSALESEKSRFQQNPASAPIADLTNRIYQADVGSNLVADGLFLRPYSGRVDDLYCHLVQDGNRSTPLDFFAILDSLPPRLYSPVSGTTARPSVPAGKVNLSDILTGGSLLAVQKFRSENPKANIRNPFKGFAVRVLPLLGPTLRETPSGQSLRVSRDLMQRTLGNPRRFTPGKVPPLFNDPSRFLGRWADPRYLRAAKSKKNSEASDLLAEIQKIDFETPLPEMSFEPVGNELLGDVPAEAPQEFPEEIAEEDTRDILRDLGLPDRSQLPPEPDPTPQPASSPPVFNADFKPAPPPLEAPPPSSTESLNLVLAQLDSTPTPTPTPEPEPSHPPEPTPVLVQAPEPTPVPTIPPPEEEPPTLAVTTSPTPVTEPPSAVALVEAPTPPVSEVKEVNTVPPSTPVTEPEIPIAKAIPVEPPTETAETLIQEPVAPPPTPAATANRFQVAVLVPTTAQAISYLKTIAASDAALADNQAETNRAECYIRWIGEAVKPFEPELKKNPKSKESEVLENLIRQARNEVVILLKRREDLKEQRLRELDARADARRALETELQTSRRDQLTRLTGTGA